MSLIVIRTLDLLFSSPGQSLGRAIVLPLGLAVAAALANVEVFTLKFFYVMGRQAILSL